MDTKWILGISIQSYKERLISLKLLPLCHYVELHHLLFLAITRNEFDITTNFKTLEDERTRQRCRGELKIENNRLVKSDEKFFHRTKQLYNVVNRSIQKFGGNISKHTITKAYWHFFTTQFSLTNKCSWRIICRCDNCNNWKKLDNWNWTDTGAQIEAPGNKPEFSTTKINCFILVSKGSILQSRYSVNFFK